MTETNDYLENLKLILYITKIYGLFPFVMNKKDTWLELLISYVTFTISLIAYATAFTSCLFVMSENLSSIMKHYNFTYFVRVYTYANLRFFVLIIPFVVWNKRQQFEEYWKFWKLFQDELNVVTKTSFKFKSKMKLQFLTFMVPFNTISAYLILNYNYTKWDAIRKISVISSISIANLTLAYWYANCIYFTNVLQNLAKIIQKTVDEELDHLKLQKLMKLWINVCDLQDRFSTMHSIVFVTELVLGVLNSISSLYSAIMYFIDGASWTLVMGEMMPVFSALICIAIYCETAYTVYVHLTPKLEEILLNKNTNEMDRNFLTSMRLFLNVIETRDPKIRLHGFLPISRSTFIAALSACMNFLIILRQFGSYSEINE